jgi:hypothetical protein
MNRDESNILRFCPVLSIKNGVILEKNVKGACENFRNYIEVMKHLGGEEVVDY